MDLKFLANSYFDVKLSNYHYYLQKKNYKKLLFNSLIMPWNCNDLKEKQTYGYTHRYQAYFGFYFSYPYVRPNGEYNPYIMPNVNMAAFYNSYGESSWIIHDINDPRISLKDSVVSNLFMKFSNIEYNQYGGLFFTLNGFFANKKGTVVNQNRNFQRQNYSDLFLTIGNLHKDRYKEFLAGTYFNSSVINSLEAENAWLLTGDKFKVAMRPCARSAALSEMFAKYRAFDKLNFFSNNNFFFNDEYFKTITNKFSAKHIAGVFAETNKKDQFYKLIKLFNKLVKKTSRVRKEKFKFKSLFRIKRLFFILYKMCKKPRLLSKTIYDSKEGFYSKYTPEGIIFNEIENLFNSYAVKHYPKPFNWKNIYSKTIYHMAEDETEAESDNPRDNYNVRSHADFNLMQAFPYIGNPSGTYRAICYSASYTKRKFIYVLICIILLFSILEFSPNYYNWHLISSNFILGKKLNKLKEYPISKNAFIYSINGNLVFHTKFLWLDYMKKILFLKKLYSSKGNLWFITNRYEYLGILDCAALNAGANIFHFDTAGQFSNYYQATIATLNYKMKMMGIKNSDVFTSFHNNPHRWFFLINNEARDAFFINELSSGIRGNPALCVSVANSDALKINTDFYGLYGNNTPIRSKYFFLHLLEKCKKQADEYLNCGVTDNNYNKFTSKVFSKVELSYRPYIYFSNAPLHLDTSWDQNGGVELGLDYRVAFKLAMHSQKNNLNFNMHFDHINNTYMKKKMRIVNNYFINLAENNS